VFLLEDFPKIQIFLFSLYLALPLKANLKLSEEWIPRLNNKYIFHKNLNHICIDFIILLSGYFHNSKNYIRENFNIAVRIKVNFFQNCKK